jgi:hypothetical protein
MTGAAATGAGAGVGAGTGAGGVTTGVGAATIGAATGVGTGFTVSGFWARTPINVVMAWVRSSIFCSSDIQALLLAGYRGMDYEAVFEESVNHLADDFSDSTVSFRFDAELPVDAR